MSDEMTTLLEDLSSRTYSLVIAETLVFSSINFIAFLSNFLIIIAVYRNSTLDTIPNMCVVALAISDILMSSFCMPFSAVTLAKGKWVFGETFCQLHGFGALTFGMVSILTMGLISVNRYFCVVRPNQFKILFTRRRTRLFIAATWCLGLIGSVPPHFFKPSGFHFQPGKAMCLYMFNASIGYTLFIETFYVATPLLVIAVCYAKVFREVSRTNKVFSQQNDMQSLRANVAEAKVTKTLVTVLIGSLMCWCPVVVIDLIDMWHSEPTLPRQVYLIYTSLAYLSSTLNPFIYGIMNRTFRREYYLFVKSIFCFKATGGMVDEP